MSNIKILPPELISKIAAGEVVERPASVIKEMLENSIDAKATDISMDIKDAGRTEILIKDNGCGIAREDLEQMFQRHATSKIKNIDDLYNIHSLGFRGEALYSIGAIADVTLQSHQLSKKSDSGWEMHIRGGQRLSLKPSAFAGPGTMISVKELFFNTPARRKFMETDTTEFNQIVATVVPYALLYPNFRIKLTHNGKTTLDVKPTDNHIQRVAEVLKVDEKFLLTAELPLTPSFIKRGDENKHEELSPSFSKEGTNEVPGSYKLHLILGDMNLRRPRRDLQYLFINGRPVQSKNISFAISQAYRLVLPPDEFPVFVAMIDIAPEDVDANVHPTKREVKIRNEQELCSDLRRLCEQVLMTSGRMQQVLEQRRFNSPQPPPRLPDGPVSQRGGADNSRGEHSPSFLKEGGNISSGSSPVFLSETPSSYRPAGVSTNYSYPSVKEFQEQLFDASPQPSADSLQKKLRDARLVGIFRTKYVLWEHENSLLLMDQHAAAERINYESLIVQMEKGQVDVQRLLSPVTLKLMPQDMSSWEETKDALEEIGFSTDLWQDDTIAVHSHPRVITDIEQTVRHILAGGHLAKADHEKIARRACRCSIMTGDPIKTQEAESLRSRLLQCLDPLTCPHGRPTVVEMTEGFLDRQFLRT